MQITKSDFLIYLGEPMHFWARIHDAETSRHFDEFQQHLALQGQATEGLAEVYLQEILLPQYDDADSIWQAEYADGNFYARLDGLIHDKSTDAYDIFEIKATTSPENYLEDVAFQRMVCEANIKVDRAFILHLNKDYRRSGKLDLSELFIVTQMDVDIDSIRDELLSSLDEAIRVSKLTDTSSLQSCTKPGECPCQHLCHPDLPDYPIYDIPRLHRDKIDVLRADGIFAIEDIPATFDLTDNQREVVDVVRASEPFIDRAAIRSRLDEIVYPISFLDYEAVITAIPEYDGYYPNQNMAFQYSLHILASESADIVHHEFLADGNGDPARALVEHLAACMPASGSVVVWNKSYEGKINKGLADLYPDYHDFALGLNDRLYDLMRIFSQGLYRHRDFHGSASIKYVLPVLVPEMTYSDMPVAHGGQAVQAWNSLVSDGITEDEKAQLRKDMLEYCKQDSLAMVEIWKVLRDLCSP